MTVVLMTNPTSDFAFRSRADACLAGGADSPARLQLCLRTVYPKTVVRDGIVEHGFERWYAYREGHWLSALRSRERGASGDSRQS